jgi:hypothetical protein
LVQAYIILVNVAISVDVVVALVEEVHCCFPPSLQFFQHLCVESARVISEGLDIESAGWLRQLVSVAQPCTGWRLGAE